MEVAKHVNVDFKEGKIVLEAHVAALVVPALDGFAAKVESGEIDPVGGTDLDKVALLKAIELIKAELLK